MQTMRFCFRIAVAAAFCLCGTFVSAQEITGRWTGSAEWTDGGGTKRTERSTIEIKTSPDGKFTANSVNREGKPGAALKIDVDGGKVNLYRFLELDNGEHLRWKLELKDGKLAGSFSAQHDNPKKWMYDRLLDFTMTKVEVK